MKNLTSIAAVSLAVLLGATACSTSGEVTREAKGAPPAPASSAAPTEKPADKGMTAKFGETFTYKDGIALTVSAPENATAGKYAVGASASGETQIYTVTLVNGTSKVLDPVTTYITANYGTDGAAAEKVFDSANGMGMTFEGKILPGKKQVGKVAFAIPASETDVLVSVTPDFAHDAALFSAK